MFGDETWRIADLGAKHALLFAGSGWGLMPEPIVRDDLASGRLVRLDLPDVRGFLPIAGDLPFAQPAGSCRGMADPTLCEPGKLKSPADVHRKSTSLKEFGASWPWWCRSRARRCRSAPRRRAAAPLGLLSRTPPAPGRRQRPHRTDRRGPLPRVASYSSGRSMTSILSRGVDFEIRDLGFRSGDRYASRQVSGPGTKCVPHCTKPRFRARCSAGGGS